VLWIVAFTVTATACLLAAEYHDWRPGVWLSKPLASTGFVALALAAGALTRTEDSSYGLLLLAALVLSWLGDVLLIPRTAPGVFRAGILSFLLGHVAFALAFLSRGLDTTAGTIAAALVAVPVIFTLRWLRPHVPLDMAIAVRAYVLVIASMVVCAAGTVALAGDSRILVGALMFFVSDLAVARERFVTPGLANQYWGLPLYYGGQLVLASTAGWSP
jgi:uncharacterized membrane protein YhhN